MSNDDVKWWKHDQQTGAETPGDTDAADIVGRTGEEMPEVAHDDGRRQRPDTAAEKGPDVKHKDKHVTVTREESPVLPGIDAQNPDTMPRAEDDEATRAHSPEFHDRPGSGRNIADRHQVFDNMRASAVREAAGEIEGQLGPDELPDPSEVIMNQEAKLHH